MAAGGCAAAKINSRIVKAIQRGFDPLDSGKCPALGDGSLQSLAYLRRVRRRELLADRSFGLECSGGRFVDDLHEPRSRDATLQVAEVAGACGDRAPGLRRTGRTDPGADFAVNVANDPPARGWQLGKTTLKSLHARTR